MAAAILAVAMSSQATAPANAKAYCVYAAEDTSGHRVAAAGTHRKKMGTACDRARRQCNRKLKREQRRKEFGRTHGCLRIAAEHR